MTIIPYQVAYCQHPTTKNSTGSAGLIFGRARMSASDARFRYKKNTLSPYTLSDIIKTPKIKDFQ